MKLSDAKEGQDFTVTAVNGSDITVQAMRFGIDEGTRIHVQKNIRGGPVIIAKNQLEIAIGRSIAEGIEVSSLRSE